jgi:hypothetical protein
MRYPRSHPLWPVYDLQQQILQVGGKIDRHSDLLAHFEGKSLNPDASVESIFSDLVFSNSNKDVKHLYSTDILIYKKIEIQDPVDKSITYWQYKRIKQDLSSDKDGYVTKGLLHDKSNKIFQLKTELQDNEIAVYHSWSDYVVKLNPKYTDIIRLMRNGYDPETINMKNNKNLLPALIIALGLIIASLIYAYATRYECDSPIIIDKWNSTYTRIKEAK